MTQAALHEMAAPGAMKTPASQVGIRYHPQGVGRGTRSVPRHAHVGRGFSAPIAPKNAGLPTAR